MNNNLLETYLGQCRDEEEVMIVAHREHSIEYFDLMTVLDVGAVVPAEVLKGEILEIMPVDEGYDVIRVGVKG